MLGMGLLISPCRVKVLDFKSTQDLLGMVMFMPIDVFMAVAGVLVVICATVKMKAFDQILIAHQVRVGDKIFAFGT